MQYPNKTREMLFNLALRLRKARKYLRYVQCAGLPIEIKHNAEGQCLEAWNTYQAAKQIVFHCDVN